MKKIALFLLSICVLQAEGMIQPPKQDWSFTKTFGTFDRKALQRGFQVYKEVCSACHSMNLLRYRDLKAIYLTQNPTEAEKKYAEKVVKVIAATVEVKDGPNDQGEMFERPGEPHDRFWAPFPNEQAARAANGGAYPVDLSLITKARMYGADYVYALLTGYHNPPPGVTVPEGRYYNKYFPGHEISMTPPLTEEGQVSYSDGTKATVEQMSHDVTTFLAWASEPEMEARKRMGIRVLFYLLIFTVLMYFYMHRVWSKI